MKRLVNGVVAMCLALVLGHNASTLYAQGVPQQAGPLGVKPSAKEVELGRKLFFDPRLSADGTVSCASCHNPQLGWSDNRPVAVGIRGQRGTRNSPTIVNASYSPLMFWDGRTVGQITQALLPLVNPIEMGNQSEQQVIQRLRLNPGYVAMFADTYGIDLSTGNSITAGRLARAVASFQSTVISFDAPIDRYLLGQADALTPDALVGYNIFKAANCLQCHPAPLYTDNLLHNNGMESASKSRITDGGRFTELAKSGIRRAEDVRAFKTPPLRNLKQTGPYNHAGTFDSIRRCVIHYNAGGANNKGQVDRFIDKRIKPLGLTGTQVDYLVRFLEEGLTSIDYPLIEEPELP